MKAKVCRANPPGFAVIVVVTVIALLSVLALANARSLFHLSQELRMIEARQQKKYQPPQKTNAPPPSTSLKERIP